MTRVLLLSMPYGSLDRPALGLSLLKAGLARAGFQCDIRYLTFPFAEMIGHGEYCWIASSLPYTAFAGDWTFTRSLYGDDPERDKGYINGVLREQWRIGEDAISRIYAIREKIPYFLDYCLESISWNEYSIIGFTSTFEQNIASLALAKLLKERYPEKIIVFGGANWEGEMGLELHRKFPFVDYACSGEADVSFPELVRTLDAGMAVSQQEASPAGIVYRDTTGSHSTGSAEPVQEMDSLPYPDFSDYFQGVEQSTVGALAVPTILLETSRGCWWGAKSHCTFCGLNGGSMGFRSKSPARALDEIEFLADRWQIEMVEVVDNILDMGYFHTVLPALARSGRNLQIFYEVKANLTRRQIRLLRDAGVHRIQPGIESLSNHVLKLMRKGTSGLRNIQLLKWCREYGLHVDWNILYGFPGEKPEDYQEILSLMDAIKFLGAPGACGPVRLDRFSPYHTAPSEFGIINIRPILSYSFLYPFDAASLERISYYFDYDYLPEADPHDYAAQVIAYAAELTRDPEPGALTATRDTDGVITLSDTRSDAILPGFSLSGAEAVAYEYCDEMRTAASVTHYLGRLFPDAGYTQEAITLFLDSLIDNKLMVGDGEHYLSLALWSPEFPGLPEPSPRRRMAYDARKPASSYLLPELPVLAG